MKRGRSGFTLMEMMITIVIVAILVTLIIAAISGLRARAQRAQCVANLHSLYTGAELYLQQNGSWPQIPREDSEDGSQEYAQAWIDALSPFGITAKTWICPTIEGLLRNEDYSQPENARTDYIPMPFDDNPLTPHQWTRQPWFVETGNVHGNGNLIIFTDGSVTDLNSVLSSATSSQ